MFFLRHDIPAGRLVRSFMRVADGNDGWTRSETPVFDLGTIPAGNLFSTVGDLAKFASAMLRGGDPLVKRDFGCDVASTTYRLGIWFRFGLHGEAVSRSSDGEPQWSGVWSQYFPDDLDTAPPRTHKPSTTVCHLYREHQPHSQHDSLLLMPHKNNQQHEEVQHKRGIQQAKQRWHQLLERTLLVLQKYRSASKDGQYHRKYHSRGQANPSAIVDHRYHKRPHAQP